jgi:hypothetical protein
MAAERETISLIGSDKVQGTAVYGADGEKIGAIERVMIEKVSGDREFGNAPAQVRVALCPNISAFHQPTFPISSGLAAQGATNPACVIRKPRGDRQVLNTARSTARTAVVLTR